MRLTRPRNYIFGQKYNSDEFASKYRKFESLIEHAPPAEGLVDQGEREAGQMFGGLHRHFSKHFGHVWSGEQEQRREENHGAHIQLCRR